MKRKHLKKVLVTALVVTLLAGSGDSIPVLAEGAENLSETKEAFGDSTFPETENVSETNIVASGKCGYNATYTLDSKGILIISGSGQMFDHPFENYYNLIEKIIISDGITNVGSFAFQGFNNVKEVEISDSVTNIGGFAFENCTSLKSIKIPNSVTNIEVHAFGNCASLKSIEIPNGVTSIGSGAFENCSSLESIELPNSITAIEGGAFMGCISLKSVEIPNGVTRISEYTFENCTGLKNIEIPNSVTSIGSCAFQNCSSLESIEIPSSVTSIEMQAFCGCLNLLKIKIKGNETNIGQYALGYELKEYSFLKVNNFVLYCYPGSTAETYAKTNDIAYKYIDAIDDLRFYDSNGNMITNQFTFDGSYTYFMQADGSPMRDTLTYHPDGEHIIYLDSNGHEVFNSFQYCPSVGYTCYFDSNGYIYKDQITFVGDKTYYLNGNGKMENEGWFQFSNGRDFGYANWDGTLNTGGFSYDPWGRVVFYHWNGMVARGLITDGQWYYLMDETDGHYVGSFPVN